MEWDWILDPDSWSSSRAILVCCLSCLRDEPDDLSVPGLPHALIAPFARANYYRAAMLRLHELSRGIENELGVARRSIRLFCNSRIPEKPLLAATGLGTYGKNGCCIVPGLGSLFVIAGAIIPLASDELLPAGGEPARDPCGSCDLCMRACPTGAILSPGVVDQDRCLQAWAGAAEPLPDELREAWGARLYGCQTCQSACPHNGALDQRAPRAVGEIGPSLPLHELLSRDAPALKERFRGTALGPSWIAGEALLRNALLAAGNRGDASVRAEVARFTGPGIQPPWIRETAAWALRRLK